MVSRINGIICVHLPGAEHAYLVHVPYYLFSIEDGRLHYDAQVEHDHPLEEEDKEESEQDDEVEKEEGECPKQDEQPRYTMYHNILDLGGNIDNMNNLANNL